jgi:hypothetical protein
VEVADLGNQNRSRSHVQSPPSQPMFSISPYGKDSMSSETAPYAQH